ncbi:Uncharacterised protein [Mycobacteroides abscessus subsp. abscessus]|nr:Uncharacterised protein [Mycobacteroides abscessus subsp. abscessus]
MDFICPFNRIDAFPWPASVGRISINGNFETHDALCLEGDSKLGRL